MLRLVEPSHTSGELMRHRALCVGFDGTLASEDVVDTVALTALRRAKNQGRRLVLTTSRRVEELRTLLPGLGLFDLVVAENGAVLHDPASGEERTLATAPPETFARALRARGVDPLHEGAVVVATREPHQGAVLEVIRDHGLELEVLFNKGAVMVLPTGVNKAFGLLLALKILGIPASAAVGIGDAENDHSLLTVCGLGVAVADAVPALKDVADYLCEAPHGAGLVELVDQLTIDDLPGPGQRAQA